MERRAIKSGKIITFPIVGTFSYNFQFDRGVPDPMERKLLGLPDGDLKYGDVLNCVDHKSRTIFEEQVGTVGHADIVQTPDITMSNGNVVRETYLFKYHSEDYERSSPIEIEGLSCLVRVAS